MKLRNIALGFITILCVLCFTTGCSKENEVDEKEDEKVIGNCTIVECMKQLEPTHTMEDIDKIIGFASTTDAMIGSDPIWKFDSKNWISFVKSGEDDITIQATIDKESIKNEDVKLPSSSDLKKDLNNGSFTYEEFVKKVGGEGTLTSISKGSRIYTWVEKNGQRLSATFNNKSGKCTIAIFR